MEAQRIEQARQIATALGWFMEEPKGEHWAITLTAPGAEGWSLWLRWEKNRIEVQAHYPKGRDGRESFPSAMSDPRASTITVSSTRTPEAIAGEIERRFLPDYKIAFDAQAQRVAGHNSYADKTAESVQQLKATCGALDWGRNDCDTDITLRLPHHHTHTMRVSGDSVRFEYMSVPLSVALKVIEAIKKSEGEE